MTSKNDCKFDDLLPDTTVLHTLDVTGMTLWRWTHDPEYRDVGFPPVIKLGRRNYRSRAALDAWTAAREVKKAQGEKRIAKKAKA